MRSTCIICALIEDLRTIMCTIVRIFWTVQWSGNRKFAVQSKCPVIVDETISCEFCSRQLSQSEVVSWY
jgi:hypothetical protein